MSIGPPHSDNPLCKKTQAAESNKGPIMEVLKTELPQNAIVLEIGSGTGQHGATLASQSEPKSVKIRCRNRPNI